jgi:uncharacterized protein (TIGR00255 family)
MTGFGRAAVRTVGMGVEVEISSVNRRNLDVQVTLPRGFSVLEARCHELIADRCQRGRLQVRVQTDFGGGEAGAPRLDRQQAEICLRELNTFAEAQGLEPLRGVGELARLPQIWQQTQVDFPLDALWPLLEAALSQALSALEEMREREGQHLRGRLESLLDLLRDLLDRLEPLLPEARAEQERRLRSVLSEIGSATGDLEGRLLQEIAFYAEKRDVREEVDRLRGHLAQFREKMAGEVACGRALDFLCQEIARELNTLSVKASRADLNRLALEGRECAESLREQVQNIE